MMEVPVSGQYLPSPAYPNPGGSLSYYNGFTSADTTNPDTLGTYYVSNGIATAYWDNWIWVPGNCAIPKPPIQLVSTNFFTGQNEFELDDVVMYNTGLKGPPDLTWECIYPANTAPEASSHFAIAGNIPSSVTLGGMTAFSAQYGMPIMYAFSGANGYPSFYGTISASSVDPNGVTATFPLPASLPAGAYGFETLTQNADGTSSNNSLNYFAVAGSQTIAGNPFGVAVDALTHTTQFCKTLPGNPPHYDCGPMSTTSTTTPVVSLYSQNQVLIAGATVTVGANPTAVVTYNGGEFNEGFLGNTNYYTGTTRAIVADSGTNLVSILDAVNGILLENVTVGNQPVALAVSADGSTAYVANYADSTVTQVGLAAGTVEATVPVGGKPTSLAMTSGGILWVGGEGFLTEINTQDMSLVATESTSGETITSLGYSDGQSELVATTANSGSMSIDELNPNAVQPEGVYTPLASHSVPTTFGTYYNPRLQSEVQGYTATITTSAVPINTSLPGAPPLVVQDGWAVVTATPTGFTITDVSGHAVLVSETTPSPIAAIAVDSNLNVAYLTMPDSNTLLTVPLPGTGAY